MHATESWKLHVIFLIVMKTYTNFSIQKKNINFIDKVKTNFDAGACVPSDWLPTSWHPFHPWNVNNYYNLLIFKAISSIINQLYDFVRARTKYTSYSKKTNAE